MKRILLFVLLVTLAFGVRGFADTPPGFTWVNLETDLGTMAKVRTALTGVAITAIREVGVEGDYALVMAINRETGAPTPDYDQWYVFNLSLRTGEKQPLLFGYGVKQIDWIGPGAAELAITYYHCWECEADLLFTTIRFTKQAGWKARWVNKVEREGYPQPGVLIKTDDLEDDDEVDQVFALVGNTSNKLEAGYWYHAQDPRTGKVEDDVYRDWVDTVTDEDHADEIKGRAAVAWERKLCDVSDVAPGPSIGQDSKACRSVMRSAAPKK